MQYLPAPDFPTGGYIVQDDGILQAYETGRGRITMRAHAFVEEAGDRRNIVITEFPYEVQKSEVLKNIIAHIGLHIGAHHMSLMGNKEIK